MKKPHFPLQLESIRAFKLQDCHDDFALYCHATKQSSRIIYRGNDLDSVIADRIDINDQELATMINAAIEKMGYEHDLEKLPVAQRLINGFWSFNFGATLVHPKPKTIDFPKDFTRDSAPASFYTLSIKGDTALYTNKDRTDYILAVRNPDNALVSGIEFRNNVASVCMWSDHVDNIQKALSDHGYTYTGPKSISHTIGVRRMYDLVHAFALHNNIARLAEDTAPEPVAYTAPVEEDAPRPDQDDCAMVYQFKDAKQRDDYAGLYNVLMDALDQACNGKGKERHANDKPFEEQPMQTHCDSLGSPQGMGYQVMKKTAEAMGMSEPERQIRELLGAVNYAAGMIIWINRHNK